VLFCLLAVSGRANTYQFGLVNATVTSGSVVTAYVDIITRLNQIEVQITNATGVMNVDTEAISSIDFLIRGVSGLPAGTTLSLTTPTNSADPNLGGRVIIGSGGAVTFSSDLSNLTAAPVCASFTTNTATCPGIGWQIASSSATVLYSGIKLSTFPATPDYLIASAPPYTGANGSITGASHNPFLETSASQHISFKLNFTAAAGINENTQIDTDEGDRPRLNFGTSDMGFEVQMDNPEPGTVAMMLGGLGLIVVGARRRRKYQS